MLLISVAGMIGIETTSFIAVIGAVSLAVGLALQGSLSNFAGGVLILIFKHFKVGDTIEAQGFLGAVAEIRILYTVVNTFDNRRVVIPNGSLSNETLVNVSVYNTRRCDMSFGIHYDDDIDKAKAILQRLFDEDERSLKDPEPRISVGSLGDNSVNLMFRAWVATDNLWPYYWDMHEKVKKAFDEAGITIPFPQRDVHVYNSKVE
jgi:small conductance mechanosensitive channel